MALVKRNKTSITGLVADLEAIGDRLTALTSDREAADGDLTALEGSVKTSLVGAINAVVTQLSGDASGYLQIASNLSDLSNVVAARSNLDVYSTTQIETAILMAQEALGSNHNVASLTERDALTNLETNDRVFVADDGDTRWAVYKPTAFDADGNVSGWTKLMDEDSLANSIDAAGMRSAYLENADTNAYVDADKTKVDWVSVTQAISLDDVATQAGLYQDAMAIGADETGVVSASGVKTYIDNVSTTGGPTYLKETLTVSGSTITLTHAPRGGVRGVFNFATVRHLDLNGVAYDAPVIATADPRVFTVSTANTDEWNGLDVDVQYVHETVTPTVDESGYADQGTLDEPT